MKKQLLSTSAIALGVAMASPVAAQQWDVNWGGFYNTHVAISDIDGDATTVAGPGSDYDGVDVYTNAEIIFSPTVTLDNGMTFGATLQLEALNSGGGRVDESYVTISSDMLGKIILGSENSAGYLSMVAAPQVGSMPINSGSQSAFVPVTGGFAGGFRQASRSSYTEVAGNNDVQRITYFTPSFNGLTVGVSYAASGTVNAGNNAFGPAGPLGGVDRNVGLADIFDIGVNYSQSYNGVDVALGARWGTGEINATGQDPETWGVGGSVGVSNFTFGVGYTENDADTVSGAGDSEGLSVGVAYDLAGPWTIGLEGYFSEIDNGAAVDGNFENVKLAGSRELGTGVSWDVYYMYVSSENAAGDDIDGNVFATAINLSF